MVKVLIVCTSASDLGGHATGAWSEEITGPYYQFVDAGHDVTIASTKGGEVPIDAGSISEQFLTENDKRFQADEQAQTKLKGSIAVSEVDVTQYDVFFFSGGHGTCVDFPDLGDFVTSAYAAGKVVGSVCHGPTCLVNAKDGTEPLVKGKKVAAFTDKEEDQVGLTAKVPFLLEAKLRELGAEFVTADPWTPNAVSDGRLITGQNPQSSVAVAKLIISTLGQ